MGPNHSGAVALSDKFDSFSDVFSPRRVAHVNDFVVKLAKVRGEFVWHSHVDTDEMFLVHRGTMTIRYRDRDIVLGAGELHVVPRGTEHMTLAAQTCEALIFERAATVNTGDADGDLTAHDEPFV
jgi:mannose-6-phosphate isomerase-like protein (cupin superfamily)